MGRGTRDDGQFTGLTVLTAAAGAVLLLPPLLSVAGALVSTGGVPALAVYLFTVWLIVIVLVAVAVRRSG